MASPQDIDIPDADSEAYKPFTVEENILQLNAIDKSIVQLMNHTSTALNSLSVPTPSEDTSTTDNKPHPSNTEAQMESFRSATDSFLMTLHSIDVRMKRQIFALEEAGIVDLTTIPRADIKPGVTAPGAGAGASLKPNGTGAIGNLDVGWLNSRGTKIEREMEAELWQKARAYLEKESA